MVLREEMVTRHCHHIKANETHVTDVSQLKASNKLKTKTGSVLFLMRLRTEELSAAKWRVLKKACGLSECT